MRITAKDKEYYGKLLRVPEGHPAGDAVVVKVRVATLHAGGVVYLLRDEDHRPEYDNEDVDAWEDVIHGGDPAAGEKYVRAGLYLPRDAARKGVEAYARELAAGAPPAETVLRRETRVARGGGGGGGEAAAAAAAPTRHGARRAASAGVRAATAAAAAPVTARFEHPDTDDDVWDDLSPDDWENMARRDEVALDGDSPPEARRAPRMETPVRGAPRGDAAADPLARSPAEAHRRGEVPAGHTMNEEGETEPLEDVALEDEGPTHSDSDSDGDITLETFLANPKWQPKKRRNLLHRDGELDDDEQKYKHDRVEGPKTSLSADDDEVMFFQELFTPEMQGLVFTQTNLYAAQQIAAHEEGARFDDDAPAMRDWTPLTRQSLMQVIGVLLFMSTIGLRDGYKGYFETRATAEVNGVAYQGQPFISEESGVTLNAFEQFIRFVHFADNSKAPDPESMTYDKAWKISPLLNMFNKACASGWTAATELSIDEMMIAYKGRYAGARGAARVCVCVRHLTGRRTRARARTGVPGGSTSRTSRTSGD